MFGFGSDSKGELEENMQEIKGMIENGSEEPESQETVDESQDTGNMEQELEQFEKSIQEAEEQAEEAAVEQEMENGSQLDQWNSATDQNVDSRGNVQGTGFDRPQRTESQQEQLNTDNQNNRQSHDRRRHETRRDAGKEQQSEQTQDSENNRRADRALRGQTGSEQSSSTSLNTEIPEPAETRQLDVPDIDKGPLFIKRAKFERAARLIQDMRYLTDQIEATVNTIEEDIQRAHDTESDVRTLLDDFETGRTEVEDIVSPDNS